MNFTIAQLNGMEIGEIWDLYSDPGEDEVNIVDWDGDFPGNEQEEWMDWAQRFVHNNSRDVAEDGFVGINGRTDLDIYRQLRAIGFYNLGERE